MSCHKSKAGVPDKPTCDISDRINSQLPVKLTSSDVDKYPELIKLLTSLSTLLSPKGASQLLETERKEAIDSLKHEKFNWLHQHIIYSELQELLLDHQLCNHVSTPSNYGKFYKSVRECLTFAEIGDYIKCNPNPSSDASLFGISTEEIQQANPHRKHIASIQQKLIPEIEQCLRKKGDVLVNFHGSSSKPTQFSAVLESEKHKMEYEQNALEMDKAKHEKQFWQYYRTLMDSLSVLENLIMKHRLQSQSESDGITSEWLTARCDALCLKIKLLEYQVLCDTYYAETVQALTVVRNQLDLATHDVQQELNQVSQSLSAYESVGPSFDALVQEYTKLKDEIENKNWGLKELQQSLTTPGIDGLQ